MSIHYIPNQRFEIKENAIIHLAGKAHDLKKVSNPQDYYEANFELTKQLFDAFLASKSAVFIFTSTEKAFMKQLFKCKNLFKEEILQSNYLQK